MSRVPIIPGPALWWTITAEIVVLVVKEILRRTTPETSSKKK